MCQIDHFYRGENWKGVPYHEWFNGAKKNNYS